MLTDKRKRLLIFASGGEDEKSGGSGFAEMVRKSRLDNPELDANIVGVISNYPFGGVYTKAIELGIDFEYWPGPFIEYGYKVVIRKYRPDFIMLSGWLKKTAGLNPATTINIHPGPLPGFGGKGLYGHYVHEAVLEAFHNKEIDHSAVSMHFVTEEFDKGPIIVICPVEIKESDTSETLAKRVNDKEHEVQSKVLNWVIQGKIKLINPEKNTITIDQKIWEENKDWFNVPGQKYEIIKGVF